jgi:hypothetical protein
MSSVSELNAIPAPVAATAAQPHSTIPEVCKRRHISLALYYDLKKRGLGPHETRYPGSPAVRISAEAEAEWDRRLDALQQTEEAAIENQRRVQQRRLAGKKAAKSATHVNNAGAPVGKVAKRARGR